MIYWGVKSVQFYYKPTHLRQLYRTCRMLLMVWVLKPITEQYIMLNKKGKIRLLILLGVIWVVVTLPLPWIVGNPNIPESQALTILGIIGIISIPFVMLATVWMLKPELTT